MFAGGSDLAWGDFDADGDQDLAVGSEGATVVFRNDAGTLTQQATTTELPGYNEDSGYTGAYDLRSLTWADVDNDADLDLFVPSVIEQNEWTNHLLRNDGAGDGGWTFTDAGAEDRPDLERPERLGRRRRRLGPRPVPGQHRPVQRSSGS